jgi:hypothetical protein
MQVVIFLLFNKTKRNSFLISLHDMNRILLVFSLLLCARLCSAQKDTVVTNLPMVDGKLVYAGNVNVTGQDSVVLNTTANNWLKKYFKYYRPCATPRPAPANSMLSQGVLEYDVKPGLINIPYQCLINIEVTSTNQGFSYKIYDIHFGPKSRALNAIGYERDPEYLIGLYKQKHIGFIKSMTIDRHEIRDYLSKMNSAIIACISSLKTAMTN